jgi:hypothetical protein
MTTVYVLWHVYELNPLEEEESKLIGIYSSQEKAQHAIARLRSQPGFRDYPNGFIIDQATLDTDDWKEGFASISPEDEFGTDDRLHKN